MCVCTGKRAKTADKKNSRRVTTTSKRRKIFFLRYNNKATYFSCKNCFFFLLYWSNHLPKCWRLAFFSLTDWRTWPRQITHTHTRAHTHTHKHRGETKCHNVNLSLWYPHAANDKNEEFWIWVFRWPDAKHLGINNTDRKINKKRIGIFWLGGKKGVTILQRNDENNKTINWKKKKKNSKK